MPHMPLCPCHLHLQACNGAQLDVVLLAMGGFEGAAAEAFLLLSEATYESLNFTPPKTRNRAGPLLGPDEFVFNPQDALSCTLEDLLLNGSTFVHTRDWGALPVLRCNVPRLGGLCTSNEQEIRVTVIDPTAEAGDCGSKEMPMTFPLNGEVPLEWVQDSQRLVIPETQVCEALCAFSAREQALLIRN